MLSSIIAIISRKNRICFYFVFYFFEDNVMIKFLLKKSKRKSHDLLKRQALNFFFQDFLGIFLCS